MRKFKVLAMLILVISMIVPWAGQAVAAPPWDGWVHAPLKTAQPYDWSAPDEFFTGDESGSIKYTHTNESFEGVLELDGFKQAGPYVLTVDTADGSTLAGYGCDIWNPWAQLFGETFPGGTNGCWDGNPYADIKLFNLEQYDSNGDGFVDEGDYYGGTIEFDVPLLDGTYNLKFFVKLDWRLTSPNSNIMMMNDMGGHPKYGKVVQPKGFNYDEDLVIENGLGAEKLFLATSAWCCGAPSEDPGYQGRTGVVFYSTVANTFAGVVVLSDTVNKPSQPWFQIKLEGLGSDNPDPVAAWSNNAIGNIGRWWGGNLGFVVFDGIAANENTLKMFALDSSYHVLWNPEPGRPAPGEVVMADGQYKAIFALTENLYPWRGVFLSENPLEFTIVH